MFDSRVSQAQEHAAIEIRRTTEADCRAAVEEGIEPLVYVAGDC